MTFKIIFCPSYLIFGWRSQRWTIYRTFLGDTDGAATHANPQGIHASVYEVFSLSSCHH